MKIKDIDFELLGEQLNLTGFNPKPHYSKAGDCLSLFFKNEEYYAEGLTKLVDLFKSEKTGEVIGVQIHGISKLLEDK